MQRTPEFWGVDVAKDGLVIADSDTPGQTSTIGNNAQAIGQWLAQLPKHAVVAMESTGRYHGLLARMASAAGLRVYVLNAKDVHFYAKALGKRGKTDRIDAGVIAQCIAQRHAELRPWQPGSPVQQRLWQLLHRRTHITGLRAALLQSLAGETSLAQALADLDAQFDRFLDAVDAEIDALVAADAQLTCTRQLLQTIPGVGRQTSVLLAALFGRVSFTNADALVAFSGLDPRPSDSGAKQGRRRISKRGSAFLRRMLYLAALSAVRNKAFKPGYLAMKARGLAATQALVVLARKLLRIAFALYRSGKPFMPAPLA